ncbi:hypothetical protein ASE67_08960 [Sphingomonas sp. Leaf23]|nr:hypothetical protein ASE67_08960 [Sphingomonas sp. Leaf23]
MAPERVVIARKPFESFRRANHLAATAVPSGIAACRPVPSDAVSRWASGEEKMRLLVSTLLLGQASAPAAPPMTPVNRWNVEYAEKMCVVSRGYGDPAAPVTIGFKPTPFGETMQAVILGKRDRLGKEGRFELTLEAPGRDLPLDGKPMGTRVYFPKSDDAVLTYYISRATFDAMVDAPVFTVRPKTGPAVSVALGMGKPLVAALRKCEVSLLEHLGYDPAKIAAVVTRAEGEKPAEWISYTDYPSSALNRRAQGVATIAWTISTTGRVSDCKIVETSGSDDLDKASCDAILRRGRYLGPALDASGKAVESYSTSRVMWSIPR